MTESQYVNLDAKQREALEKKHVKACIFTELRRAGFAADFGNTRCFKAAERAIKLMGVHGNPNRMIQIAMEILIQERDLDAEAAAIEEIRL